VPASLEHLSAGKVMVGEHWYAFSSRSAGINIALQATRLAYRYDGIPPHAGKDVLRGAPAHVSQNEAVWTASWEENGASYTVDVECALPDDARCKDANEVKAIVASLVYAGRGGAP
jgi:hypothetical protein